MYFLALYFLSMIYTIYGIINTREYIRLHFQNETKMEILHS